VEGLSDWQKGVVSVSGHVDVDIWNSAYEIAIARLAGARAARYNCSGIRGREYRMEKPLKLMLTGLALLIIGVVLPFVMVVRLVTPTLLLSFVSYASSTAGFIMGFIGLAQYGGTRKRSERQR